MPSERLDKYLAGVLDGDPKLMETLSSSLELMQSTHLRMQSAVDSLQRLTADAEQVIRLSSHRGPIKLVKAESLKSPGMLES